MNIDLFPDTSSTWSCWRQPSSDGNCHNRLSLSESTPRLLQSPSYTVNHKQYYQFNSVWSGIKSKNAVMLLISWWRQPSSNVIATRNCLLVAYFQTTLQSPSYTINH